MWTRFMDMHSGGRTKEGKYEYIYIEAPEQEAKIIFYNRFGHNPDRITCTCCGNDYSISESKTLAESTAYDRGCKYDNKKKKYLEEANETKTWHPYAKLNEYLKKNKKEVLVIYKKDIKASERVGEVPEQGYVWVD